MQSINVNDNVIGFQRNNNDNVKIARDIRFDKSKKVENIADILVEKFGNPGYRAFYCKIAWKLTEAQIWNNVEAAMKGTYPSKLFTHLCKRDGV